MGEYYKTKASVKEYINAAEGFSGKHLIDKLENVLPSGSDVLEIGSGPGTDWNILNQVYNVVGSDNSSVFIDHLKSDNSEGKFIELDAITIETGKKFDGIYSNKVLHHLKTNALLESIKRQSEILNKNGIICHSFWKGEGSEIFKGLFVNYHSKSDLEEFFKDYFDILSIEYYNEFEDDDSLLLIGKKK